MKILYLHQYFSTPRGAGGIRSYEMARRADAHGHQVLMVCGSAVRGNTGLSSPFNNGRRRGYVDGIEVLEFDLAYSNRHGFIRRTAIFFRFALLGIVVSLTEEYDYSRQLMWDSRFSITSPRSMTGHRRTSVLITLRPACRCSSIIPGGWPTWCRNASAATPCRRKVHRPSGNQSTKL